MLPTESEIGVYWDNLELEDKLKIAKCCFGKKNYRSVMVLYTNWKYVRAKSKDRIRMRIVEEMMKHKPVLCQYAEHDPENYSIWICRVTGKGSRKKSDLVCDGETMEKCAKLAAGQILGTFPAEGYLPDRDEPKEITGEYYDSESPYGAPLKTQRSK